MVRSLNYFILRIFDYFNNKPTCFPIPSAHEVLIILYLCIWMRLYRTYSCGWMSYSPKSNYKTIMTKTTITRLESYQRNTTIWEAFIFEELLNFRQEKNEKLVLLAQGWAHIPTPKLGKLEVLPGKAGHGDQ